MTKIKITVIIEKTPEGFFAYAKEVDGLTSFGKTEKALIKNFDEVLDCHIEYLKDQGSIFTKENFMLNYQYEKVTSGEIAEAIKECLHTMDGVDEVSMILVDEINPNETSYKKWRIETTQITPERQKQFTVTITDNRPD